ncbi:hypothetical protein NMY22_g5724 [Coprinellus aureogranulatus]|nr:hypothetical protein NMY22_g5724 [Coprinellus aureogranulatus]
MFVLNPPPAAPLHRFHPRLPPRDTTTIHSLSSANLEDSIALFPTTTDVMTVFRHSTRYHWYRIILRALSLVSQTHCHRNFLSPSFGGYREGTVIDNQGRLDVPEDIDGLASWSLNMTLHVSRSDLMQLRGPAPKSMSRHRSFTLSHPFSGLTRERGDFADIAWFYASQESQPSLTWWNSASELSQTETVRVNVREVDTVLSGFCARLCCELERALDFQTVFPESKKPYTTGTSGIPNRLCIPDSRSGLVRYGDGTGTVVVDTVYGVPEESYCGCDDFRSSLGLVNVSFLHPSQTGGVASLPVSSRPSYIRNSSIP